MADPGVENHDIGTILAKYIQVSIILGSSAAAVTTTVNGTNQINIIKSDPMREMRFLGSSLLNAAVIIGGVAVGATVASSVLSGGTKILEKVTGGKNALAGAAGMLTSAMMIIMVALIALGLVLAFIIPALPYTTWTLSLLTYLIVFAEAMIASLFWALAHAWPEGEGLASQLATKGWMLYLQVLMTPILMLGGFWIGAQIVYIMGWWVDNTLWTTLELAYQKTGSIAGYNTDMGIFTTIGHLIVYTGLMFAIVWKSFDMTSELKNWVFEWIGGSSRSMGENAAQSQHLMGVVGGAKSTTDRAASATAMKGGNGGGGGGDKDDDKKFNDMAQGNGGGGNSGSEKTGEAPAQSQGKAQPTGKPDKESR